jgi:hypothetical protein
VAVTIVVVVDSVAVDAADSVHAVVDFHHEEVDFHHEEVDFHHEVVAVSEVVEVC